METVESVPEVRARSRGQIARIFKISAGFAVASLIFGNCSLGSISRAKISLGMPEAEAAEIDTREADAAMDEIIKNAREEQARLEEEIKKRMARIEKLKREIEELKLQGEKRKLTPAEEAELNRIRAKRAALQREMAENNARIKELRKENAGLDAENAGLDAENARLDDKINKRNELLDFLYNVPVD